MIDGGFKASGEKLVEHIRDCYNTNRVDFVISTHPDQDHVNGLKVILEEMEVGTLLMHLPWDRSEGVRESKAMSFKSQKIDDKFEANFSAASDLEELARAKGIPVVEPFEGVRTNDGCLEIVGPSEDYYVELLEEIADGERSKAAKLAHSLKTIPTASAAEKLLPESLDIETLTDAGETSPQNNSSVITLFFASAITWHSSQPTQECLLLKGQLTDLKRSASGLVSWTWCRSRITAVDAISVPLCSTVCWDRRVPRRSTERRL